MRNHVITCDSCGIEKSETNHWFFVIESAGCFRVYSSADELLRPSALDVCGEACVTKLLQKWLARPRAATASRL